MEKEEIRFLYEYKALVIKILNYCYVVCIYILLYINIVRQSISVVIIWARSSIGTIAMARPMTFLAMNIAESKS